MKLFFKISLLLLFFLISPILASSKNVLILNSYHNGFQWSDNVISGIETSLKKQDDVNINILYMDAKRISTKEYYEKLYELYKVQLKSQKYDLIILIDRFAYDFILKYYYLLFTDEPLLFSGLESYDATELIEKKLDKKMHGVLERRAIDESFSMILSIMPNLKKLYVINDISLNGESSSPFIQEAIDKNSEKVNIELIRSATISELDELFKNKKSDEAIFFIRFYTNKYGELYKNEQIASMINKSALPIFVTDTLFIEKGAVGGKLVPIIKLGELTGNVANDILSKKIKTPYFETMSEYNYIFDKKKLDEFSLNPYLVSKNYQLVNAPLSFFKKNRQFIDFIFVISPFLFLLLIGLIYNLFLRIKSEKVLRAIEMKNNKDRQFIIQQSKLAELGEVFSSIAHQWKNPLVEISTISQEHAMMNQNDEIDEKYVKDIMSQVTYMTDTINDFQNFIVPSTIKTFFNIEDSILDMLKIIKHTIKYNYINVEINKTNASNLVVSGYKNEFMQILLNIINNAKDAIVLNRAIQTIKVKGVIKFNIYNDFSNVILEISDNGGGIKKHTLNNIFSAYFTTKKDGHGIGLYMSKLIIEDKMNGKIEAFNTKDGACFKITLEAMSENTCS